MAVALGLAVLSTAGGGSAAGQATATEVRVVAAAFKQHVGQVESYATFGDAITAHFDTHVAPALAADRPNLVVYPDRLDVLGALIGLRGLQAREALTNGGDPELVRTLLVTPYAPQIAYYRTAYPEVEQTGWLLQLALTDTIVRAIVETFADLAAEHGVYLFVGTALPDYEEVTGPEAALLRDPEAAGDTAYRATSTRIRAATLVFGPDGDLVARRDRLSVTREEAGRDTGSAMVSAAMGDVATVDLPFGRIGVVAGGDAWMPDIVQRLDRLGADLLVQPLRGGAWAATQDRYWAPDYFQRGTWLATQAQPSLRASATAFVTGNLGSRPSDGQPVVTVAAPSGDPALCLAGGEPEPGWAVVGAWNGLAGPPSTLCGAEQRPDLRATAAELRAGSGQPNENAYFEGAVVADVPLPAAAGPATRVPSAGFAASTAVGDGEGMLLLPHVATGQDEIWLTAVQVDGHGQHVVAARMDADEGWEDPGRVAAVTPPSGRRDRGQWAPAIHVPVAEPTEAIPGLEVAPVVEPVVLFTTLADPDWNVVSASFDRDRERWRSTRRVDSRSEFFEFQAGIRAHTTPTVLSHSDGSLVAIWSDLRWPYLMPQVRIARAPADGGWSDWVRADGLQVRDDDTEEDPVQPDAREPDETRGQVFPAATLIDEDRILIVWQEPSPDGVPSIYLSRSEDRGATFAGPERVDATEGASWRPALAASGRSVWLVWEQETAAGGRHLWRRRSGDGGTTWTDSAPLDGTAPPHTVQQQATVVPLHDGGATVVFEDDRAGDRDVLAVTLAADGTTSAPARLDDGPDGADARAPSATLLSDGRLLVAWEDTRGGSEHVRTAPGSPPAIDAGDEPSPHTPPPAGASEVAPAVAPLPTTGGSASVLGLIALGLSALLRRRA